MTSEAAGGLVWLDFARPPLHTSVSSVTLQVGPWPQDQPPVLGLSVDGGPEAFAPMQDHPQGLVRVVSDRPFRSLAVRVVAGPVTLEGFAPEFTSQAGLTVDTFGVPGARGRGWRQLDLAHLLSRPGHAPYDLIVLAYGTNEASEAAKDLAAYALELRRDLRAVRAAHPHAACMLAGPPDRGVLVRPIQSGGPRPAEYAPEALLRHARIHASIGETQRKIAAEFDCGFWDWQAAMGGPGGIYRWYHAAARLAARDLIHLNAEGYRLSGRMLGASLREHLERAGR
jgi:lysophospholipase L1-like esterase